MLDVARLNEEGRHCMSRKVADLLWEMLANAGVKRYGIVGNSSGFSASSPVTSQRNNELRKLSMPKL
jgi:hypothetical protein